jgi:pyruvate kinase
MFNATGPEKEQRRPTTPDKKLRFLNFDPARVSWLVGELDAILHDLIDYEARHTARIDNLNRAWETSSRNLLHYLALLRHDLLPLRKALSSFGLSSLGRSESHVMASIISVLRLLNQLLDRPIRLKVPFTRQVTYEQGFSLLEAHAESLFGPPPTERRVRIMVTFASDAADNYTMVRRLIENGMDCARINCAHDDPATWEKMCANVRKAERETGRRCRILMDLGGPKLRTGPLAPGPQVLKLRPVRDALGAVVKPALVWLSDGAASGPAGAVTLPVLDNWYKGLKVGDAVVFRDARNKLRRMIVERTHKNGCLVKIETTAYIVPAIELHCVRRGRAVGHAGSIGALPHHEESLLLKPGDRLVLSARDKMGRLEQRSPDGTVINPATIPCTLPEVFFDVKKGERICFDDGKIIGIVESVADDGLHVKIVAAKALGSRLRADKGINLPDSSLSMPGLTGKDIADLEFITRHADIVALSFVRDPSDIALLHRHLTRLGSTNIGVVLKIETGQAVRKLPSLLIAAMALHPIGVMIARGDLAVELGFDNLAGAQEEILLTCEAAHVPVIWATQVLENLAKFGMPSRAEISDAAMGVRAECVMLNKGEYIGSAVTMLDVILKRMERRSLDKVDYRKNRDESRFFIEGLDDEKK